MKSVSALHDSSYQGVVFVTGGGASLLTSLLAVPGASRTLLDAQIPYGYSALSELLGTGIGRACSDLTARAMAVKAFERALGLGASPTRAFGFGLTAAIATSRVKRGRCLAHIALHTHDFTSAWGLELPQDGSRADQEEMVRAAGLDSLTRGLGLQEKGPSLAVLSQTAQASTDELSLFCGAVDFLGEPGEVVFPGSFNPCHEGHREMRSVAERILAMRVSFELCIRSLDKTPIDYISLRERLAQFGTDSVLVTSLPRFVDKAERLRPAGGLWFVVGVDTIKRIASLDYYELREYERDQVIARMAQRGDRFLVFGRLSEEGVFATLESLAIPVKLAKLCRSVAESDFRFDLSSTDLRAAHRLACE